MLDDKIWLLRKTHGCLLTEQKYLRKEKEINTVILHHCFKTCLKYVLKVFLLSLKTKLLFDLLSYEAYELLLT
jgi:hypothetical protein